MKRFKYLTLAALVAFAACDEGDDVIVGPAVTGTISGVVTIEGTAASGVTVTLSSGASATTDASGSYSFTGVEAGAYTVSISGLPSDATFSSTSKAATISSAGQVVTVNFDGSFVRTSAILGSVSAGGSGLEGVTVSLGGGVTTTTDANGQYSFSGLRSGSYTVSISGWDSSQYTFAETSKDVTVGAGESKAVSFSGQLVTTASISGSLFIDENDKDNAFTASAEDKLAVAGVPIIIEGGGVAVYDTVNTDANGDFAFTDLPAGTYRVAIDTSAAAIPGAVTFGGTSTETLVTVTTGSNAAVYWPFDIIMQWIQVGSFLGTDLDVSATPGPMVRPLDNIVLDLYDTYANAVAAGATGRLDRDTTEADGYANFNFMRTADDSPAGGPDAIVFARIVSTTSPNLVQNGESVIEIQYATKDSLFTAKDEFDFLRTQVTLKWDATTGAGIPLPGWNTALYRNDTATAVASIQDGTTNSSGIEYFTESTGPASLPDTFYVRLSQAQAAANGHAFRQDPDVDEGELGTSAGRYIKIVHDGTQPDTVMLGTEVITYLDADILIRAHDEQDDSTDVPVLTLGDQFANSDNIDFQIYRVEDDGSLTSVRGPYAFGSSVSSGRAYAGIQGPSGVGLPTGETYEIHARSRVANQVVLNDTVVTVNLDGGYQVDTIAPLAGNAGFSTFAWKYSDGTINGNVRSPLPAGVNADGLRVTIAADPMTIQPNFDDTTLVVTGGSYSLSGLREGIYNVTIEDSAGVWAFFDTVGVTAGTTAFADNTDERLGTRDVEGPSDNDIVNFQPDRMDTKVEGVIVNDRDADQTTIDPNEALPLVTIELYRGSMTAANLVGVDTTDATGTFAFDGLREGNFIVHAIQPSGALVLWAKLADGSVQDTTRVTTTAAAPVAGQTAAEFDSPGDILPRWDYDNSVIVPTDRPHMTFLYNNGTATGTVVDGSADPVEGMTVSIRRCETAPAGAKSPPQAGGTCTTYDAGFATVNVVTDANGDFTFSNLLEGNYEVRIQPTTKAGFTSSNPSTALYQIVGLADVEDFSGNFVVN